jgi:hypothetical protein
MVMLVSDPSGGRSSPPMTGTLETPCRAGCDRSHNNAGFERSWLSRQATTAVCETAKS